MATRPRSAKGTLPPRRWLVVCSMLSALHCGGEAVEPTLDGSSDAAAADVREERALDEGGAADGAGDAASNDSSSRADVDADAGPRDTIAFDGDGSAFDQGSSVDANARDGEPPSDATGPGDVVLSVDADGASSDGAASDVPFGDADGDNDHDVARDGDVRPIDVDLPEADAARGTIVVAPLSGLSVNETGTMALLSMVLGSQPQADVIVALSSTRLDEGTVAPAQITFTPTDWNAPHWVTVTGVNDNLCDGSQDFQIVTSPSTSLDPSYDGIDPSDVTVTNLDNEGGGITVIGQNLTTSESGMTATFTIVLNCQPLEAVFIPIASTDTTELIASPPIVAFTTWNWNVPATATVTPVDDTDDDGDQSVTVTIGPSMSADPGFEGLVGPNISVTNLDND